MRRALRRAAADADRERDLGLGDPLAPMMARQSAAVLGVRSDGAVSGPEYERLVDRRRRELLISDQAVDRAEAAARSRAAPAPTVNPEIVAMLQVLIDLGFSVQGARAEIIGRFGRPATAAEIAAASGGRAVNG